MFTKQTLFSGCLVALLGAEALAQSPLDDDDDQQAAECPAFVRGSTLSVRKVDRGVQLTIATPRPNNVRLLRAMTYQAAGYIETQQRGPGEDTDTEGLPPLDLAVADIAGGARISILAVNKSDVAVVREQANKLQQLWRFNVCVNGSQMRA
jgi:hypothetical protein